VSDPADAPFPPEEICAQAQSNAAAWILTMIAYLKESGGAVEDCVAYHGRSFAPAWEGLRGGSGRRGRAAGGAEHDVGGEHVTLAI
jgi:hypothetical protein